MKRFTLTPELVRLLRAAYVSWNGLEWGAPTINPKRPYGNGDLDRDLYYALATPDAVASDWDSDFGLPSGMSPSEWRLTCEHNRRLHFEELETALQVVLAAGSFEPGEYVASDYGADWRPLVVCASCGTEDGHADDCPWLFAETA